jgi:hypothetical protein
MSVRSGAGGAFFRVSNWEIYDSVTSAARASSRWSNPNSSSRCRITNDTSTGYASWGGPIVLTPSRVKASKEKNFGYNAQTDTYEDLVKAGVIDPTKVSRTALQNAASIAGLLLTTECVVVERKEEKVAPAGAGGGMGGMGGMY